MRSSLVTVLGLLACALPAGGGEYSDWYGQNMRHAEDSFQGQQDMFQYLIDNGFDSALTPEFAEFFQSAVVDELAALTIRLESPHDDAPADDMTAAAGHFRTAHEAYVIWLASLDSRTDVTTLWEGFPEITHWGEGVKLLLASRPDDFDHTPYSFINRYLPRFIEAIEAN